MEGWVKGGGWNGLRIGMIGEKGERIIVVGFVIGIWIVIER